MAAQGGGHGVIDAARAILWRPSRPSANAAGGLTPALYWATEARCPIGEGVIAYSTDDKPEFVYEAFNEGRDFGPLDIARTVMYCRWVDALCTAHAGCAALVHIASSVSPQARANSAALCGAYLVLAYGYSAEEAWRPFAEEPLPPFIDCRGEHAPGSAISDEREPEFELSMLDVMRGLRRARDLGWLDYRSFGVEEHSSMLRPEHGDMSWLIPGKALALASPWAEPRDQDGLPVCTPELLSDYFHSHGVSLIVQCNHPDREEEGDRRRLLCYEPRSFDEVGITHIHLPFEDGGCPSVEIILRFLELVRQNGKGFAVHCRSGLGRTATLIGVYAIQNLGFTARSFIGWARVMRPGTVHGSQQQYLCNLEPHIKQGALRPLTSLDPRERIALLPRRELRFWALDAGIPGAQTRDLQDADIVERVLEAQGVRIPPRPVSAMPVTLTRQQPLTNVLNNVLNTMPTPAQAATTMGVAESRHLGSAQTNESTHSAVNGDLSATMGAMRLNAPGNAANVRDTLSNSWAPGPGAAGVGAGKVDEWDEVLRYLHLLTAVQAEGAPSWDKAKRCIEQLRDIDQVRGRSGAQGGRSAESEELELQQLREAREDFARRTARCEGDFNEALQQASDLQRECEELRRRLLQEREEAQTERRGMEEYTEGLQQELRQDEGKLEQKLQEVEELRRRVLRQGGLERWQVERAERLRQEISDVREANSQQGIKAAEQRARMDAQSEHLRMRDDLDSRRGGSSRASSVSRDPNSKEEYPWDNARRSIEQLRDRFQMAVQQARMTIAAS